jgi:hypothetical protein
MTEIISSIPIRDFIYQLRKQQVKLTLADDKLSVKFPGKKLPEEQLEEIRNRKEEIMAYLQNSVLEMAAADDHTAIEPVEEQEHYGMSHAQQRLWVVEQFEEARGAYNILYSFSYHELDCAIFEKSIRYIMQRHQVLRTRFAVVDGEPRQQVVELDETGFCLTHIDLRNHPSPADEISRIKLEEEFHIFDLSNGPLIRVTLLRLDEGTYRVVVNLHHIISDGWSSTVLEREFAAVYSAFISGAENPLQPLLLQYKDFSSWQKNMLDTGNWSEHRQYWHETLANAAPLEFPTDYPRPAIRTYNGEGTSILIHKEISNELVKICEQEKATPYMALLACVKLLLFRYTGQEDIVTGTVVAGRDRAELENQLGFYINTLVLRSKFSGNDNFRELLRKIKKVTIDAYTHQQYPFDMLVDELQQNRSMNRSPFFDVVVDMQNFGGQQILGDTSFFEQELVFESTLIKFDLSFTFSETDKGLIVTINYSTDLFGREKMTRMFSHFTQLVTAVVKNPAMPVSALNYLSPEETKQLVTGFNSTEENTPPRKTIIQLFEEQASLY